jgi:O-antigen ligase
MEWLLYFFVFTKPWLAALSLSEFPFRTFKDVQPGSLSSTGLTGYVDAAFLVFSLIYLYRNREPLQLLPYRRLWYLFLGYLLFTSLFIAPFPWFALRRVVKVGVLFSIYAVAFLRARESQFGTVTYLKWILRSAWIPVLYGVGNYLGHADLSWTRFSNREYREYSTFYHANPFAYFCVVILVLSVMLWYYRPGGRAEDGRLRLATLGILTTAALLTTGARAALLGSFVAYIIILRRGWKVKAATACVGILVLLQMPTFANPIKAFGQLTLNRGESVSEAMNDVAHDLVAEDIEHTGELAGRLLVWSTETAALEGHYAFGYGLGYSAFFYEQESGEFVYSHNDYLTLTFETGLCGLTLYWSILIGVAWLLLGQRKGLSPDSLPGLLAGAGLFLIVFLAVVSCTDNLFIDVYSVPLIWSILGAATGSVVLSNAKLAFHDGHGVGKPAFSK